MLVAPEKPWLLIKDSSYIPAEDTDPTLHGLHRKATADAWEKLRSNILFLATENSAICHLVKCALYVAPRQGSNVKDVGQRFSMLL